MPAPWNKIIDFKAKPYSIGGIAKPFQQTLQKETEYT